MRLHSALAVALIVAPAGAPSVRIVHVGVGVALVVTPVAASAQILSLIHI